MKNFIIILFIILLSLFSQGLFAQNSPSFKSVKFEVLKSFESKKGEDLDSFVLRVSKFFKDHTQSTGFEVCGMLSRFDDGRLGLLVVSNNSNLFCLIRKQDVFANTIPMDITIHSHSTKPLVRANLEDIKIAKLMYINPPKGMVKNNGINGFSKLDYKKPGFLVLGDKVFFQEGPGTDRVVGIIE